MKHYFLIALCAAVAVAGCATQGEVATKITASAHRVGVVSMVGNDVQFVTRGLTIFNNSAFQAHAPEWQVDQAVVDHVLADLGHTPKLQAAPLDLRGLSVSPHGHDLSPEIRDAARRQGFDTVVLVQPGVPDNYGYLAPGIGIYRQTLPGLTPHVTPYAGIEVVVANVMEPSLRLMMWGEIYPLPNVADSTLPMHDNWDQFTAEDREVLRTRIVNRLVQGIDRTLASAHLSGA